MFDKLYKSKRYLFNFVCAGLTMMWGLYALPAWADELSNPFDLDNAHWMSFERHLDNRQKMPEEDKEFTKDQSATPEAPAQSEQKDIAVKPTTNEAPKLAAPAKPIILPVMPGLNKGFAMTIQSTVDDQRVTASAKIVEKNGESDLKVPENNWQNSKDPGALNTANGNELTSIDDVTSAVLIRPTYLPNRAISPTEPVSKKQKPDRQKYIDVAKASPPPKANPVQTVAECAAIDAYKKRELQAIQSDKQTLQALQEAIKSLGFQKQLGFLTESNSVLNAPATNMDLPATSVATP